MIRLLCLRVLAICACPGFLAAQFIPAFPIRGHVVDSVSKKPVSGANVTATKLPSQGPAVLGLEPPVASVTTAEDGSFAIPLAEEGRYSILANKPGYRRAGLGMRKEVRVRKGDEPAVMELVLTPESKISGRVVDEEGKPVPNLRVLAWDRWFSNGSAAYMIQGHASTDSGGNYTIEGLGKAIYYVGTGEYRKRLAPAAAPPAETSAVRPLAPSFWPTGRELRDAAPLHLNASEHREGIDLRVREGPRFCVRGEVTAPPPGGMASVDFERVWELGGPMIGNNVGGGSIAVGERFALCGVGPGRYRIVAYVRNPGSPFRLGNAIVEVTKRDVEIPALALEPLLQVETRVVVQEGSRTPEGLGIIVFEPMDRNGWYGEERDAHLSLADCRPVRLFRGRFRIRWVGRPAGYHLASATFDGLDVTNGPFEVAGPGVLTVRLRGDAAAVSGVVKQPPEDRPVPGARVFLVPDPLVRGRFAGIEIGRTDERGSFRFSNVPPGNYRLLALVGVPDKEVESFELIQNHIANSEKVKLDARMFRTVELRPHLAP
ncbi:MAG: carboxypeptidase-like regulatory domain-containing protein [Bryobacteraceae bacterium]|nr:carboxypeptidase-like regulatory domain-containing protein [Bryobacteraceae bacterium]